MIFSLGKRVSLGGRERAVVMLDISKHLTRLPPPLITHRNDGLSFFKHLACPGESQLIAMTVSVSNLPSFLSRDPIKLRFSISLLCLIIATSKIIVQ